MPATGGGNSLGANMPHPTSEYFGFEPGFLITQDLGGSPMALEAETLLPVWETCAEFLIPGFGLVAAFGE